MRGPFPYQLGAIVRSSQVQISFGRLAPVCEITVSWLGSLEVIPAILDSGASRTVVPHKVAVTLNLRIINPDVKVGGATGPEETRPLFMADLNFLGLTFQNHPVISLERREHAVIGRDILNLFKTTLDGPQQQFTVE